MSNLKSPSSATRVAKSKEPPKYQLKTPTRLNSLSKRRERAAVIIERLRSLDPDPRCELYYETPYQLLVSVVLSAQTTDKMVNRCMEPLYKQGFGPQTVLTLGEEGVLSKIRRVGFAPTKSRNIVKLTEILVVKYGGEVPEDRDALEALPGVGRKTANVILGEIFRQPTLAVDTHVLRVGRRLGLHGESTSADKAERELLKVVDPKDLPQAHHWLILHGRYTCKALRPACDTCCLRDICPSAPATI